MSLKTLSRLIRKKIDLARLRRMNPERAFTHIYNRNTWGAKETTSGPGSDLHQTRVLREKLPELLDTLGISTMLDIPCGDFHWMSHMNLGNLRYLGADIVTAHVDSNQERYGTDQVQFRQLDLITSPLPKVDAIFCRDCLVHLSFKDALTALDNIRRSQSTYLITTTFSNRESNHDIITGDWRPLNLLLPPFELPDPLLMINEGNTEGDGIFADKTAGVWKIDSPHDQPPLDCRRLTGMSASRCRSPSPTPRPGRCRWPHRRIARM